MEYTVHKLAQIAGLTPRTLRWYDKIGLLHPARVSEGGYRLYSDVEVDRLQEILLYRDMGIPLKEISSMLSQNPEQRQQKLNEHLLYLQQEHKRLEKLIQTVEHTLQSTQGGYQMNVKEKFEGFKKEKLAENEHNYGEEIRAKYDSKIVESSNNAWLNLKQDEYQEMKDIEEQILSSLEQAVRNHADPCSSIGTEIYKLHQKWLNFTLKDYTNEVHISLAEMYVSDPRFTAYYDRNVKGCAVFLQDVIIANTKQKVNENNLIL